MKELVEENAKFCTLLVAEFIIDSIAVGRVRRNTMVAVTSHK